METTPAPTQPPVPGYLKASVFLAGVAVMAAEMAAPRLLAPSFGTSQLIWTNIIATVLASLTIGAWVGGRLADRWPTIPAYARVLALAGAILAVVPLIAKPILAAAARALAAQQAGTFLLSLFSVCLFFAPPILLLGMVGPWAVRLAAAGRTDLGRVAGMLSGLSALGSILGTFLGSLVALPLLGTSRTILAVAALLLLTGGWGAFRGVAARAGAAALALLLLAVPVGTIRWEPGTVYEADSLYQYVQVRDFPDGRRLYLSEGQGYHSVLPPHGILTGGYWDYMAALPALRAGNDKNLRVLIVGLAGGTTARQMDHCYARTHALAIDGVEIDPAVIECGRRYFKMGEIKTLTAHAADGRAFLASTPHRYDVILIDAFRQPYIPFHMTTKEFFELCRSHLTPGGVLAMNVGATRNAKELLDGFSATLVASFPHAARFELGNPDVPFTNYIYMAAEHALTPDLTRVPMEIRPHVLSKMRATWIPLRAGEGLVFTDDRAPVEMMTNQMILRVALGK